jgi:hypothetical protein
MVIPPLWLLRSRDVLTGCDGMGEALVRMWYHSCSVLQPSLFVWLGVCSCGLRESLAANGV